jgi:DNA repair protein RadA/Sms
VISVVLGYKNDYGKREKLSMHHSVHSLFHSPRKEMPKEKTTYTCNHCQATFPKWSGQCSACKSWNTIEESQEQSTSSRNTKTGKVIDFSQKNNSVQKERISTGSAEVDRVFGGGITPDSLTLLIGNPGIGKSTLALQIVLQIAKKNPGRSFLVFSGEESAYQVCSRADRLGGLSDNVLVASAFQIEDVVATVAKHRPALILVDSVQTFSCQEITSGPASLPQIRAVTEKLMFVAKSQNVPVILIGQVNKGGEMAGPQVLAHLVDTVLQFEGDDQHDLRILRSNKNRFGATSEVGIFEMTEKGLKEVQNPSAAFLSGRLPGATGSAIFPAIEGDRPCLVEVQALTASTPFGLPKRSSSGTSLQRLALLLAVIEKHAGVRVSSLDVFVNVVGGIKIEESAADLSICLAVASSKAKKPVPEKMIVIGEVGLSGEIRAVSKLEKRLKEGEKLGFTTAVIPSAQKTPTTKLKCIPVQTVTEAVKMIA